MMCNQSSDQDSSLEDEESKEVRQTIFFTPLNPLGDQMKKYLAITSRSREKYTIGATRQDAVYWNNLARTQDKGLQFWQTRSHAIIVYSSVPASCIHEVISQKGQRTLFERLSTPRPAPKIVHKSAWQSQRQPQQQQPSTSENAASGTRKLVQKEEQGTPTDFLELPSVRKNRCEVLRHLLRKKGLNLKSTSELKDSHKM